MQNKAGRKNSTIMVKHTSRKMINKLDNPIKGRMKVDSKVGCLTSSCSAILVVETKNERLRTIREYEKQRDALRSVIER